MARDAMLALLTTRRKEHEKAIKALERAAKVLGGSAGGGAKAKRRKPAVRRKKVDAEPEPEKAYPTVVRRKTSAKERESVAAAKAEKRARFAKLRTKDTGDVGGS